MTKKPNIRRRIVRPKSTSAKAHERNPMSASERQTLVATNFVMNHSHYPTIIAMMRMGTSNADITDFFLNRGDFTINRKTAVAYLSMFRKSHPELCKPVAQEREDGIVSYDHLFDGNAALITADVELAKLIALQKNRVSIDFKTERGIGKLFSTTHKEVQILGNLLEQYAKIKGLQTGGHSGVGVSAPAEEDVKDGLQNIKHDEEKRAALSNALYNLIQPSKG